MVEYAYIKHEGGVTYIRDTSNAWTSLTNVLRGADSYAITTTIASSATPTPERASQKTLYIITALATNPTFGAPTGTPQEGDALLIWITDNGTSRTISYNAIYTDGTVTRPTSTTTSTRLVIMFIYDGTNWRCDYAGEDA